MTTSTNEKPLAITELVRQLGYDEPTKLANAVRDIIKDKEDFDKYIVEDNDNQTSTANRPEKILVSPDAKTLVDNLYFVTSLQLNLWQKQAGKRRVRPFPFTKIKK